MPYHEIQWYASILGSVRIKLKTFKIPSSVAGSFGDRVRFGCTPLDFANQEHKSWKVYELYRTLDNVEVYSCYKSLCNSVDIILKENDNK